MPFFSYPRIPGHELGVEVVAVGPGVTNVKPGDRAAVEPYINCQKLLLLRSRPHQLLREPPDARRPLRRRPAAAVHVPARKLHVSDEAHVRATRPRRDARHRPARGQPREPAGRTRRCSSSAPGRSGCRVIEFAKLAGSRVIVMDLNEQRLRVRPREDGRARRRSCRRATRRRREGVHRPDRRASSATWWWTRPAAPRA